ncbi:MAG: FAD-dependent oxidoreductase [Dehalococcoidia bacterium]
MKLFEPISIGTLALKNRLVMPPMNTRMGDPGGFVSQRTVDYYARRAQGGVGLIIVEIGAVDPVQVVSSTQLQLSDDRFIPGMSQLAQAIKDNGSRAAIQIHHPGRQAPNSVTGTQAVAPSALNSQRSGETPRELTPSDIEGIVGQFAQAARRAKDAGFEAVEIHGAHGYLLCQFLSPYSNQRQDDYGGDTAHRARFPIQVVAAVRQVVGRDFPIIFRFSASEFTEGGLTVEDGKAIARMMEEAGVDCLSISAGTDASLEWAVQPVLLPVGCLLPLAAAIREEAYVPVIAVGRINHPSIAEAALQEGKADLIALGRPLLADPDYPLKAQEGRWDEIRKCIACNSCRRDPLPRELPICCLLNPETGNEGVKETPADSAQKVLVIGAGPAGMEAARVAALRGHQVTLWEEAPRPGGRWSWLQRGYIGERMRTLRELGVAVEMGKPVSSQAVAALGAGTILATPRAAPVRPTIPGSDGDHCLLAGEVLDEKQQPTGRVAVLGIGNTGCEVAHLLSRRGVPVTLMGDGPVGHGLDPATGKVLVQEFQERGGRLLTGVQVTSIEKGTVSYRDAQGNPATVEADWVVLAGEAQPTDELPRELASLGVEVRPLPYCGQPRMALRAGREGADIARQI